MAKKTITAEAAGAVEVESAAQATGAESAAETVIAEPPETAADKQQKTEPVKRIYAGATVPGMRQNTVFIGEMPAVINVPFVRELCMGIADYPNYVREKRNPQSRAAFCYKKSVELAAQIAAAKK